MTVITARCAPLHTLMKRKSHDVSAGKVFVKFLFKTLRAPKRLLKSSKLMDKNFKNNTIWRLTLQYMHDFIATKHQKIIANER